MVASLVAALDMAATALGGLVLHTVPLRRGPPSPELIGFVALLVPCVGAAIGAYGPARLLGGRRAGMAALTALVVGVGGMILAAAALGAGSNFRPVMAALWVGLAAPPLLAGRAAAGWGLRAVAGRAQQRAVLVGSGPQAARFAAAVRQQPDAAYG
ncbi:hypothetical protein ACFQU2_15750 [Siccirubricoccus deserti]